jgi:hypothetical protein
MRKLAAITAAFSCLIFAGSASAVNRSFFGVVSAKHPTAQDYSRMGSARVGTLRLIFNWASIQPSGPGAYDWSSYDSMIGQAAQQGIRVLPTIYGSPRWAAAQSKHPPSPDHYDEFTAFCRAAAARYGSNGSFWALNPLLPKTPIIDWQVWNEVNSGSFWLPNPNPKVYKRLLVHTYAGIKGVDPRARIMLAGMYATPGGPGAISMVKFLRGLYRAKAKAYFDSVAVHPYATRPERAFDKVGLARKVMNRFNDKRASIWLTEVGWATQGQRTPFTVSSKRQAKYLTQLYRSASSRRTRKRFKIAGVLWYSLRDIPGAVWYHNTGLFRQSGAAKPSWNAFAKVAGGTP